jgi:hypothetical protein
MLYELSDHQAKAFGNWSRFVWAAFPMIASGLSALVLEQERILNNPDPTRMKVWMNGKLPEMFETLYGVSGDLLDDLKHFVELRNEVIHPHHTATGTPDNWPDYLRHIKDKGLLNTSGSAGDFIMLSQMASHRLFTWAIGVENRLRAVVNKLDPLKQFVDIPDELRSSIPVLHIEPEKA